MFKAGLVKLTSEPVQCTGTLTMWTPDKTTLTTLPILYLYWQQKTVCERCQMFAISGS